MIQQSNKNEVKVIGLTVVEISIAYEKIDIKVQVFLLMATKKLALLRQKYTYFYCRIAVSELLSQIRYNFIKYKVFWNV